MTNDPQRHMVWIALSRLFLDTELTPEALKQVEDTLRASPYDLATIDQIMLDEVSPVCLPNLRSIAGIWDGFDEDQLIAECAKQSTRRVKFAGLRRYLWQRSIRANVTAWQKIRIRLCAE